MERKHHCFMVGRRGTRLSNYFKCCSLITSIDDCPMLLLSCSWHVFSWAWVIRSISKSVSFFLSVFEFVVSLLHLSINMSLSAAHLRSSSKSLVYPQDSVLFLSIDRTLYQFFHHMRSEGEERFLVFAFFFFRFFVFVFKSNLLLYSCLWGDQITQSGNFTDEKKWDS